MQDVLYAICVTNLQNAFLCVLFEKYTSSGYIYCRFDIVNLCSQMNNIFQIRRWNVKRVQILYYHVKFVGWRREYTIHENICLSDFPSPSHIRYVYKTITEKNSTNYGLTITCGGFFFCLMNNFSYSTRVSIFTVEFKYIHTLFEMFHDLSQ